MKLDSVKVVFFFQIHDSHSSIHLFHFYNHPSFDIDATTIMLQMQNSNFSNKQCGMYREKGILKVWWYILHIRLFYIRLFFSWNGPLTGSSLVFDLSRPCLILIRLTLFRDIYGDMLSLSTWLDGEGSASCDNSLGNNL